MINVRRILTSKQMVTIVWIIGLSASGMELRGQQTKMDTGIFLPQMGQIVDSVFQSEACKRQSDCSADCPQ